MARFMMKYYFVSSKSNGSDFFLEIGIEAKTASASYAAAKQVGFDRFGSTFTDNCVDWRIIGETT